MPLLTDIRSRPASRQFYDSLKAELQQKEQDFLAGSEASFAPENQVRIEEEGRAWLKQPQASEALAGWMSDIVTFLDTQMLDNGPTGHDRRHLAKDLSAGFRHVVEDGVDAFQTLSLIPSFLHDTGRLVEAHFHGVIPPQETSRDHALFSFGIAHQFTDKPYFSIIPQAITDQILYAILKHSFQDPRKLEMTLIMQTADREQLIGPEGIARLLAVQTGTHDVPLVRADPTQRADMPKDDLQSDLDGFHSVERYLRYLYPQCDDKAEKRADQLKAISAAFLLLAAPDAARKQIFAPELQRDRDPALAQTPGKKIIPLEIWQQAKKEVASVKPVTADVAKAVSFILRAPGNAVDPAAEGNVRKQFALLSNDGQAKLTTAIVYADAHRQRLDAADLALLQNPNCPPFARSAAAWAARYLAPASN